MSPLERHDPKLRQLEIDASGAPPPEDPDAEDELVDSLSPEEIDEAEIDEGLAGLEVGTVFANAVVASMNELPFGGTKRSGIGRELSFLGAREFTNAKSFFVS